MYHSDQKEDGGKKRNKFGNRRNLLSGFENAKIQAEFNYSLQRNRKIVKKRQTLCSERKYILSIKNLI